MIDRDEAIRKIEKSRDTHIRWLDFYDRRPEQEDKHGAIAGDRQHQLGAIERYDSILEFLRSLPAPTKQALEDWNELQAV